MKEKSLVTFFPMEDLDISQKFINPKKVSHLVDVYNSYTYFSEGDVLLAKITPCFENGKLGIAKNLENNVGFGSSEYMVFRTQGNVEPDFLYYFLSRNSFKEEGKNYMSGAVGHKRVSKDWIENYLIQFPKSRVKQRTITRKLDSLQAEMQKLEANYQERIHNLEELKKSILQKTFAGELETGKTIAI